MSEYTEHTLEGIREAATEGPWKVEVIADNSGKWVSNALTFATEGEAMAYAIDLASRWTLVREWRVVPVDREEQRLATEARILREAEAKLRGRT